MIEEKQSCSSSSRKPPFFSIPNLKPLLPSYTNIPKPIIDPPATASNPFLNPNPHCVQFPEKQLSSMDVDPCLAASRSEEIVDTRTTDLTAAEHAGVSLSEPTLVSTTFEFPANSEVVASQTVKDEIVTKNDRKNAGLMICDVCNVTCNTEKLFKKHKEGKKHIKNTQKPNVASSSNQETPSLVVVVDETSEQESEKKNQDLVSSAIKQETQSPVATHTLGQDSEEKNQNLLLNEGLVDLLVVCSIPDPGCDNQKIATEQVTEASYKPTSASTTMVLPSNNGAQKGHAKLDAQQPLPCDVCKVSSKGNKCFDHMLGKLHLKDLEISEKIPTLPSGITSLLDTTPVKPLVEDLMSTDIEIGDSDDHKTTWCEICKINCTSNDIIRHVSGKRHKKKLQSLEVANLPSNLTASVTTPPNDPAKEKPKLINGKVVNSNKGNPTWCELCGIVCTSLDQFKEHVKGKKHQKNLKNTEKVLADGPSLVAKRASQDPMKEKGKAVLSEGSKRRGSLAIFEEDADTNNKRQKMMMKEEETCSVACNACNVVCKSLMAFKTHLASTEHSAMVLKQVTGGSSKQQHR